MKFLLFIVCLSVLTTQIYSEESIGEIIDKCETQLSREQHRKFIKRFEEIERIRWLALNDLQRLSQQKCAFLYPLVNFTVENIIGIMNGHNVLITTENWHKHLQTYGYRQNDFDEILKRVDRIPSNIWFTDHRERVMLFLKATKHKASLDDVRAAHYYLLLDHGTSDFDGYRP